MFRLLALVYISAYSRPNRLRLLMPSMFPFPTLLCTLLLLIALSTVAQAQTNTAATKVFAPTPYTQSGGQRLSAVQYLLALTS